jgi:hypothetical protein
MRSFILYTPPQISLGRSSHGEAVGGTCGTHGRGKEIDGKARRKETTRKNKALMGSKYILRKLSGVCGVDPVGSG